MNLFVALSAVTPSLLLLWFFHSRDSFREPWRVLWITFAVGVASIVPTLMVALPFDAVANLIENPVAYGMFSAFFVAAIPEEFFKMLALLWYANRHEEFDEPIDGIVYGVAASLGFATFENLLYVSDGGFEVAAIRALTAVPGHACCGAIMGYYIGRRKVLEPGDPLRTRLLASAYLLPTLLHGLYDTPILIVQQADAVGVDFDYLLIITPLVLFVEFGYTARFVRELRAGQVSQAVIPPPFPSTPSPAPVTRSALRGWLMIIVGSLSTSIGGLLLFGVALSLLFEPQTGGLLELMLGSLVLGVLPTIFGLMLFAGGLTRLNRGRSESSRPEG